MLGKLDEIAERSGVDAIIVASPENVEYFTGVKSLGDSTLLLFYHRSAGVPHLYVPLLEYYRYRDSLEGKGVEVYAISRTLKPSDAKVVEKDWGELVKTLVAGLKAGYDAGFPSPLATTVLRSIGEYVDVSNDISKVRMVKEDWEIELIERAVEVTAMGIKSVAEEAEEGVSETELAGVFEREVRRRGV
ncbi:MAG: aminopeptidase P family protein, partial [Thermogladius sp.]|nr:aminopeptidase P family protein [Thermogladius sp.]